MPEARSSDLLTEQDVNTVMKNSLGHTFKLIDYEVTQFSDRVIGFLSQHQRLSIKARKEDSADEETFTYFVKCLPVHNEKVSSFLQSFGVFHKETNFYNHILPKLTDAINDDSWCPRCYLVKDSFIIFENLATKNFIMKDRLLDISSLKCVLSVMAKFHASSLLAEKKLGKTWIELYPNVLAESMMKRDGVTHQWYRTAVDVAVAIAKKLDLDSTPIPAMCDRIFDAVSTSKTRQNVIGHGDAWSFNFMFDQSSTASKCVMLDFQILRYAPAMVDINQLFYLTMRREFREDNEQQLLRHYYDEFTKLLKINNDEIELPGFSQVLEEFEAFRIVGMVTAVLHLQVSMLDGDLGVELLSDTEGFAKLVFYDRVDLVMDIMKKDSLYSDRIIECVKEIVEKSKQFNA